MENFQTLLLLAWIKRRNTRLRNNPLLAKPVPRTAEQEAKYQIDLKNGHEFEKFVVSRFDTQQYFTLLEWRSDFHHHDVSALSKIFPDLELAYTHGQTQIVFSVECKWRSKFHNGCLEWAKEYQWETYLGFKKITTGPVFIVIGVGGQPSDPAEMYIIPLQNIHSTRLHYNVIAQYKRADPKRNFFLHTDSKRLE